MKAKAKRFPAAEEKADAIIADISRKIGGSLEQAHQALIDALRARQVEPRHQAALTILQSLLAGAESPTVDEMEALAKTAVRMADILLAELRSTDSEDALFDWIEGK